MAFSGNKPWLKKYAPGVRPHLEYPVVPLFRLLDDAVTAYPDRAAVIFAGNELSYRKLGEMVDRLAAALVALGVQKGDRVSVMLPNCPQLVAAYYGIIKAGAVVVQVNPMYMERELEYQLNNCGSEVMIILDSFYPRLQNIKRKLPLKHVITTGPSPGTGKVEGCLWLEELLARNEPEPPVVPVAPGEDLALLQYTGGTTGIAKGAMLTHFNLVANTMQTREALAGLAGMGQETVLVALPLFHVYGMTIGMNLSVSLAATMVIMPRFEIDAVLRAINDYRPTLFPGAPTMYQAITGHPRVKEYNISSIKACISGSAPLPPEVARRFEELTGGRLVEGYGLTEASPVVTVNPLRGANKKGSIGQPLPDTDCVIVNLDTGTKELSPGEIGELIVRGPQVMKGYWNMPEETANSLRDGWLYTGDVAKMDEEGYIYIVGRKKDMIIASGFNVYPRDVEEALYEHPKIAEAVVMGVSDLYRGESVKAFIVLKDGETATEEEIIQYCRERLAAFKVPQFIEFREQLPKTIVGKILRRVLVEEERRKRSDG
ncbi:MAG: long-chain fatty acid--CoA ligase [Firmicutes bacterium]|nr:long-chain fatty acid--CoA ligase [Bacillota bacterium]